MSSNNYDSNQTSTRGNYNDTANFESGGGRDVDDDNTFSGSHGGSGLGQSGGYAGSNQQGRGQGGLAGQAGGGGLGGTGGQSDFGSNQGGFDSSYIGGQDPMQGGGQDTQGRGGGNDFQDTSNLGGAGGGQYGSGDNFASDTGRGTGGTGTGAGLGGDRGYDDSYGGNAGGDQYGSGDQTSSKPGMAGKVMGGLQKMAGKASGNPDLAAKGEQRQTGQQF